MPAREELLAIARLARLEFTDEDLDRLAGELDGILAHIGQLRQVDTLYGEAAPACAADVADAAARAAVAEAAFDSVHSNRPPLRSDEPGADALLLRPPRIATEWRDGFFTVPRLRTHDQGT